MKSKKMTAGLLIFYLIALVWIILFKLGFSTADLPHIRNINLVPFAESLIVNGRLDVSEIIKNGGCVYTIWSVCSYTVGTEIFCNTMCSHPCDQSFT